jgi:hypothetical protein
MVKKLLKRILPKKIFNTIKEQRLYLRSIREIKREKKIELSGNQEKFLIDKYRANTGCFLTFDKPPVTLTQKQQWLKLYGVTPLKTECTDKYAVRKIVEEKIGKEYLIPIISINGKDHFYSVDEIDFSKLPNEFVIQCNHGSGMTRVIKDKSALSKHDLRKLKSTYRHYLKMDFSYLNGLEYVYKGIKPCIFFTVRLKGSEMPDDLPDYKFLCFNGDPKYIWVDTSRFTGHRRTTFNLDFSVAPFNMHTYENVQGIHKPEKLVEMINLSRKLSFCFDYVRVDLYNINGRIYFGELTFSSASGYELPHPIGWDKKLGEMLDISEAIENRDKFRKSRTF